MQARFPKGLRTGGFPISLDGEQGLQHRREEVPRWLLEQEWFPMERLRVTTPQDQDSSRQPPPGGEGALDGGGARRVAGRLRALRVRGGRVRLWDEYVREASEPSLSGYLTWLKEDDVGRLLDEAIGMSPRREDVLDASGRTGWDAVFALQHFHED